MQRFTISLEEDLAAAFDAVIAQAGYANRSEAVRDLIRARLEQARTAGRGDGHCVAALTYVYDHAARDLAERIAARQHAHHDLTVASLHVHLDHDNCLETAVLHGRAGAVRAFAGSLLAESGVRHGSLHVIGVERADAHAHGGRRHLHLRPRH